MNKNVYKWLAVTLLLSVSVFCYLYLAKITKNDTAATVVAEAPEEASISPETPTEAKPEIKYNDLPRRAVAIDGATIQNVGGSGDEVLKGVHTVGDKRFVFFDTSSIGADIRADKRCVAVAVLDSELTLLRVVTLVGQEDECYAGSKLTAEGFVLATTATSYGTVYKLDFNLITTNKLTLEATENSTLYTDGEDICLLSEKSDKLQVKVLTAKLEVEKTDSAFLKNPKVLSVFPSNGTLNIFCNTDDGFSLLRFTKEGGFSAIGTTHGNSLITILPYGAGYAGVKKSADGAQVFLTDESFNTTVESDFFTADTATLFFNENTLTLYKTSDGNGELAVYCTHLDETLCEDAPYFESIPYRDYSNKGFIAYADNTLILATLDGLTVTENARYSGASHGATFLYDGTICFTSPYKSGIYKNNFGSNDVFLIKNPT